MSYLDDVRALGYKANTQQFPRVWYHNGVKQTMTASQWYAKKEEVVPTSDTWKEVEKFEGELGFVAQQFRFAPILVRSQAFSTEPDGTTKWLDHYVKGARIYTEYLSFIEGIEGLAVFIVKGLAGKAVNDAIREFRKGIPNAASIPPWTFYIPLQVDTAKGKPVFQDTGRGAFVNLPVLQEFDADKCYVGVDLLNEGYRLSQEYADWAKARRGNVPEQNDTQPESPASGEFEPF